MIHHSKVVQVYLRCSWFKDKGRGCCVFDCQTEVWCKDDFNSLRMFFSLWVVELNLDLFPGGSGVNRACVVFGGVAGFGVVRGEPLYN